MMIKHRITAFAAAAGAALLTKSLALDGSPVPKTSDFPTRAAVCTTQASVERS